MKQCSGCKKKKEVNEFGIKKNNTEYKTCIDCRNRKKSDSVSIASSSSVFNNCLPGCVNPSKGLHHVRCPNSISPPNLDHVYQANREIGEREAVRNSRNEASSSSRTVNNSLQTQDHRNQTSLNWKKGFLLSNNIQSPPTVKQKEDYIENMCSFKEIYETLSGYGYKIYTKCDLDLTDYQEVVNDYFFIRRQLHLTKSVFMYELPYPSNHYDDYFFC